MIISLNEEDAMEMIKKLQEKCWKCDGWGNIHSQICLDCHGIGYVPTDAGEKLLKFFNRFRDWGIK